MHIDPPVSSRLVSVSSRPSGWLSIVSCLLFVGWLSTACNSSTTASGADVGATDGGATTSDASARPDGGGLAPSDGAVTTRDADVEPDAATPASALRCVGSYGDNPAVVFRADGTVSLVTEGTYEYLDSDTVRLTSSSWEPMTLEGSFSSDCTTFTFEGGGGTRTRTVGGRCGDGRVDDGFREACDDGDRIDCEGGCSADCLVVITGCGDGLVCGDEACDDGEPTVTCRGDCTLDRCGNRTLDTGEACDDGNRTAGDGCRADCAGLEVCGDGLLDVSEACDDAGNLDGDGCSAACLAEPGCRCATAGAPCTTAFVNTPSSRYEIVERVVREPTGVVTGGVPEFRDNVWALGYRSGTGVGVFSSEGYPIASFEIRPVPAARGTYALVVGGLTVHVTTGLGGSRRLDALPESTHGVLATEDHWRLRYVRSDEVGDRFSIQSVADGSYICGAGLVSGGLIRSVSLTTTECAWAFRGVVPARACAWSLTCGDGELAVGERCDDGNDVGGDGCSGTCTPE